MQEDLRKILEHFGLTHQVKKLREEAQEFLDSDDDPDEIADIFVLAVQLYLGSPVVRNRVRHKINRTKERIITGYYKETV